MPLEANQQSYPENMLPATNALPASTEEPAVCPLHADTDERPTLIEYGWRAGQMLGAARNSIVRMYGDGHTRASEAYGDISQRTRDIATGTRDRLQDMSQEETFRLLGIIAGSAFAVGVAARIWRSYSS